MPIVYRCKKCNEILYVIESNERLYSGFFSYREVARMYDYRCPKCGSQLGQEVELKFSLAKNGKKDNNRIITLNIPEKHSIVPFHPSKFIVQNQEKIWTQLGMSLSQFAEEAINYFYNNHVQILYIQSLKVIRTVRLKQSSYEKLKEIAKTHNYQTSTTLRYILHYYLQKKLT